MRSLKEDYKIQLHSEREIYGSARASAGGPLHAPHWLLPPTANDSQKIKYKWQLRSGEKVNTGRFAQILTSP